MVSLRQIKTLTSPSRIKIVRPDLSLKCYFQVSQSKRKWSLIFEVQGLRRFNGHQLCEYYWVQDFNVFSSASEYLGICFQSDDKKCFFYRWCHVKDELEKNAIS